MIISRRNALDHEKEPQTVDLLVESAGKPSRFILAVPIERDETNKPSLEGAPLSQGWLSTSHMAQALELSQSPCSETCDLRVFALGELPRFANQVGKAGLPKPNPFAVGPVPVAYENPYPFSNEGFKSFLGAVGVNHEKGHRGVGQHPEPLEYPLLGEGGFINMIDFGSSSDFTQALVVWLNG